jgi:hypothetical protein
MHGAVEGLLAKPLRDSGDTGEDAGDDADLDK